MFEQPVKVETSERVNRHLNQLHAGCSVTIDVITPTGKKGKFRTCFVGYLPKNYVLIQYPDSKRLGAFSQYIKPGSSITVRGLIESQEGSVVAFSCPVRQTLQTPSRLIVLEFPYSVSLQKLRSNIRVDTLFPVKIGIKNEYFEAHIHNMSISGSQIVVHNANELMMLNNEQIEIIIEDFQGELSSFKLQGNIRNVKKQNNDVSFGIELLHSQRSSVLSLLEHILEGELSVS